MRFVEQSNVFYRELGALIGKCFGVKENQRRRDKSNV